MIVTDVTEKKELLARMAAQATSANDKTSRLKAIIYGDSGVGKSVLAVGLAKKLTSKKIIFIDTTDGWMSLRNHPALMNGVIVLPYESIKSLSVMAEATLFNQPPFDDVGAFIFDDADVMAAKQLNIIWGERAEGQRQGTVVSKLDQDVPERPDYMKLLAQFGEVVDDIYIKTPDIHLIMTAGVGEKKSIDGQSTLKMYPGFSPAVAKELKSKQSLVVYMKAREIKGEDTATYERTIQCHPTGVIDAKTRIGIDVVRMEAVAFVKHVAEWSLGGRKEDSEKDAIIKELETVKMITEDDAELLAADNDEAPVFVQ